MTTPDKFESYPRIFYQNQADKPTKNLPETESYSFSNSDSDCLPVIDFQNMNPGNLGDVCRDWGMFRLVNHGIPVNLLSQLHDHAHQLFSLSFESKQALFTDPLLYFWGSPALTMSGDSQRTSSLNWLEGLNVPVSQISHLQYEDTLLESFRCLLHEYGHHQTRLAKALFSFMAEDLNIPPTKSESYLSPATGVLRVYRYLRCPMAEQNWGINAHTDSSVLTILHQDDVGGLQVYKNNKWFDVKPIRDSLIVNIGDLLQAMSNDTYTSVKHRVKVNRHKERISIGYFVFPAEDAVIESSNYRPFTFAEFRAVKELDLKTLGIKIGLPRFRNREKNTT